MNNSPESILKKDFSQLGISKDFENVFISNHISNLKDLLNYSVAEMLALDGFEYRQLHELISLLEVHKLKKMLIEK